MTTFFNLPTWVDPSILTHPNIPKPLHQVNPRTIRGKSWWDKVRRKAYAVHDDHCHACGVHKSRVKGGRKWLEAHEKYRIDHERGRVHYDGLVALCPWCHQFIHSGRLFALWDKREVSTHYAVNVLNHGFRTLMRWNEQTGSELEPFWFTKVIWFVITRPMTMEDAQDLVDEKYGIPRRIDFVPWEDWRLVLEDGSEHGPKFKTEQEWIDHFGDNGFHSQIRGNAG